jgi:hypothetical protein
MQYKTLCGEKISRLGMGNMRLPTIGGEMGPIDEQKALDIIDFVYKSGVNYFDTAYMYHGGESERFVGRALARYPRDSFFLASKMPDAPLREGRTPEDVFEEQLQKCGVEYFDFYLLHNLNEGSYDIFTDPERGVIPYLLEQKKKGRIRHFGLSSHSRPETLKRFLDAYDFPEFVQIQLNYLDWEMQDAKQQYEIITSHGIPVWVMEPCRGGRLASLSPEADRVLKQAQPEQSVSSWAFRWVAGLPNVGVVLSGMTMMEQAQDNVATFDRNVPLTAEDNAVLDRALEILRSEINVPCTACHYCAGCPMDLDIPHLLKLYNQLKVQPSFTVAMEIGNMPDEAKPSNCIACGACMAKCPQKIAIPDVMKEFTEAIGNMPRMGPPPAEEEQTEA